jgi:hypothetical protein
MYRITAPILILVMSIGNLDSALAATQSRTLEEITIHDQGERLYREGILPDGSAVQALVAGDVPVDGRMFSCVDCHQRSGLGSVEGPVIAWPVTGKELFQPRRRTGAWNQSKQKLGPGSSERWSLPQQYQAADARPAYSDSSLGQLLRDGIDPGGRQLSGSMPRYQISDHDVSVLIQYLKKLSAAYDVGVDAETIRFATIVTEAVDKVDADAMLSVLEAFIKIHNTQTRPHKRRAESGPFYKTEKYGAYRKFELDVWELTGSGETWRSQLDAYYSENPVFSVLGGIAEGSWAPIHNFCEDNEIPCIFPITDQPVISDTDWYTLYFSKGLYQEGEIAARFVRKSADSGKPLRVIQVYRSDGPGRILAQGVRDTLASSNNIKKRDRILEDGQPIPDNFWQTLINNPEAPAVLLWLDQDDIDTSLSSLDVDSRPAKPVLVSSSLIADNFAIIPGEIREHIYLTYPYDLPDVAARNISILKRWLKIRKIPATNLAIQSKMYFLGWILNAAVANMRSEFYRDYFVEGFDMMRDQDYAVAVYPRLTFGPGQRYASKGGYIVQLGEGEPTKLIGKSKWVMH